MIDKSGKQESGFTMIEAGIVILIVGAVIAFATPKITTAMREYRLNMAMRQITDLIQRAKTQAMSNNGSVTLRVDTATSRAGIVVRNSSGTEIRTDYIPLPQGVTFAMPSGVTAPMTGAPTTRSVSFPAQGGTSTTIFEQNFNSRGFPVVTTAGAINAVYITNSRTYRAITVTSIGGIRTWVWQNSAWASTKTAST